MFTGIITDIGSIDRIEARGDRRIFVSTAYDMTSVDLGASIACSGVCLTVINKGPGWFAVDVSGETVSRTPADQWIAGRRLNLERALKLGEELGGHIVTGHVDGIGTVANVAIDGDSWKVDISVPADLAPFIASKGSVTVDGVSLTVNAVTDHADASVFSLNIIPHTQKVTTLGTLTAGADVNIEIDVLARYLKRMEHYRAKA
ncbi:riboflavin synthase [Sphingomonas psychrolutea]|uniref:Riboflavin synthase n=1 Tax=Sphingomonas psychrolutea TaxID=1259676 RepID=A0ABQ1GI49_9SPHN|nr:riboflavin synthase [Sphingomonas psychrolutea]GGA44359.1 riboflavin synthase subunit alpha [Sphingomonas psychrolutea]